MTNATARAARLAALKEKQAALAAEAATIEREVAADRARGEALDMPRLKTGILLRLPDFSAPAVETVTDLVGTEATVADLLGVLMAPSGRPAGEDTLERLESGDLSLTEVFDEIGQAQEAEDLSVLGDLASTAVLDLILPLRRIGQKSATDLLAAVKVDEGEDAGLLDVAARTAILERLGDRATGVDITARLAEFTVPVAPEVLVGDTEVIAGDIAAQAAESAGDENQ